MSELLRDTWQYPHGDPSVKLFDLAVQHWPLSIPQGGTVVELGCCETDFSKWLHEARPDVQQIGIDVNDCPDYHGTFVKGDASDTVLAETMVASSAVDAVVALGSIEHFGLGYYGDTPVVNGDALASLNAWRWLAPGGWFYYDVPWTPAEYYVTENQHFRVYDDAAVRTRLTPFGMHPMARAYSSDEPIVWQTKRPEAQRSPFWYLVRYLQKEA